MTTNGIKESYFEWLIEVVCKGKYAKRVQYRRLLRWLHETTFIYSLYMDANRAEDGVGLRYQFGDGVVSDYLVDSPCSLLEMMVALSRRCEVHIMGNYDIGDRTGEWFWGMIANLGLDKMKDQDFNPEYVDMVISRLLLREYGPHGEGGLFTVRKRSEDLRDIDIWYQMSWYLDEII